MSDVSVTNPVVFSVLEPGHRGHHIIAIPFLSLFILLLGQALGIIPFIESGLTTPETIERYPDILYMLFGPFTMILVVLLSWVKFYEKRNAKSVGTTFSSSGMPDFLKGYGTGLGMAAFICISVLILGGYQIAESPELTLLNLLPVILLVFGFGLQSTVEEIFFRGWILSRIAEKKGIVWGVILSSLIFTLVHLPGEEMYKDSMIEAIPFMVMTFVFSTYLAFETLKRGSIWFASGWHAAWNWMYINGFGLATTGIHLDTRPLLVNLDTVESSSVWLSGGQVGPENSVLAVFVLVVFTFMSWKSYRLLKLE